MIKIVKVDLQDHECDYCPDFAVASYQVEGVSDLVATACKGHAGVARGDLLRQARDLSPTLPCG